LLDRSSQFWSVGAGLAAPLFDGGPVRLRSAADQAKARAAGVVATYWQQMLVALREVEDALVALRSQALQNAAQDEAQAEATIVATLAQTRYRNGLSNYLEVTNAERTDAKQA
jgi:multidrug efflux system outer membrane protein